MKSKLTILFAALLFGCVTPNHKSQSNGNHLSTETVLKHINYLQKELESQGFGIAFVKSGKLSNQFILDVEINDHKGKLLLSNGADKSYIYEQYLDRFQLTKYLYKKGKKKPNKAGIADNEISNDFFRAKADSFSVGNLLFRPWSFNIMKSRDKHVHGTVGNGYLKLTSSVLSFRTGALFSHPKGSQAKNIGIALKKLGYTEIKLSTSSRQLKGIKLGDNKPIGAGMFLTSVSFDGIDSKAAIHTGYQFSSIDKFLVQKNNKKTSKIRGDVGFEIGNKKTKGILVACFSNFCIGDFCTKDKQCPMIIDYSCKSKCSLAEKKDGLGGVIGFDNLFKYNAIIDFGNNRLYLQK